ncbi:ribosomal RNA adenine dimethylase family protein [Dictyocaulus viviparus]|uniref:rRNA adenine N(6)-methyltransferase n=1 Tax=Dictyocaulus viviparus TaxID=29172 RepID=A0A0D8Y6B3_DICVI|nr:ribosomal RNA adenine dimethylase family protein [Dictyocaulus viviparus]
MIQTVASVKPGDWVCEIGPGPGSITRAILEADCERLDVVEIDHRFIPPLEHLAEASEGRLHIHRGDILKTNIGDLWNGGGNQRKSEWSSEPPSMNIIGNLPFNVASPLLKDISYRRDAWRFGRVPLTLTFQLEVAMRLCSPVDNDARSRISVMAQYLTEPKIMFRIPGACFVPRPEIDVGVVRFVPRIQPLINASFEAVSSSSRSNRSEQPSRISVGCLILLETLPTVVEKVCRHIFFYRQKHMIKGLKTLYPKELKERAVLFCTLIPQKSTTMR